MQALTSTSGTSGHVRPLAAPWAASIRLKAMTTTAARVGTFHTLSSGS